jgi:predicted nucleic acid-binding protein
VTPIAVLDTSVAIDLHRGDLIDAFFKLPAQYMVPDIMYADELEAWFGETLLSRGLIVQELEEAQILEAREFMRRCPSLSVPDAYALALASKGRHTILAGARDMRELGTEIGIEVRGVLHVFDMIEEAQLLSPASLHTCLTMVCRSRRVRLPQEEVDARYAKYSSIAWPSQSNSATG